MTSNATIFITGGNTGLGLETVRALAEDPVPRNIIIGSRSISKGEEAKAQVQKEFPQSSSTIEIVEIDVLSDESIEKAAQHITSKYGKLDTLVNNAGANFDRAIQSGELSMRDGWNLAWNTNVTGAQVTTSTFIPLLLKSNEPRLLFISSGTSPLFETEAQYIPINAVPESGWPKADMLNPTACYRSTKTGLNMMMRQWHRILKKDGVKVIAVSPGFLATGLSGLGPDKLKTIGAGDPTAGGQLVKDVSIGKRDDDEGKVVLRYGIQPW